MEQGQVIKKRRLRSDSEWRDLLTDWRGSGLSQHAWCRLKGISGSVFNRWQKRLCGVDVPDLAHGFIPVQLNTISVPQLEIVLKSGHKIQVQGLAYEQMITLVQQLAL